MKDQTFAEYLNELIDEVSDEEFKRNEKLKAHMVRAVRFLSHNRTKKRCSKDRRLRLSKIYLNLVRNISAYEVLGNPLIVDLMERIESEFFNFSDAERFF